MVLADLVNGVKSLIGPGNYATDANIVEWVNEAYHYMCDQIVQTNPDYFTTSDTADLVGGQWEYWMPSDCEKVIMVNINYTGVWRRLTALQEINQIPHLADIVTGPIFFTEQDAFYYVTGGKIGILPMPTLNVTAGFKIWYVSQPNDLTDGQSPLFGARYHHLIKHGAFANYLLMDGQNEPSQQRTQYFEQRVQEMCETIAERQQDSPKMIEIVDGGGIYYDDTYGNGNP